MKSCWRRANWRQRLSVGDAWLLLQIAVFATAIPLLMRLPLARIQRILQPRRPAVSASAERQRRVLDLVDLALAAVRPVHRPTCLTRGVTRCYFLRRGGFAVELAFGMSPSPGVGGHCWLVRDNQPFLESRDPRPLFVEMFRI